MTPEQRLSFDVKWVEDVVKASGPELTRMLEIKKIKYCDLLDEADEILRPAHQLVYAMGQKKELTDGEERWTAIAKVLVILHTEHCRDFIAANSKGLFIRSMSTCLLNIRACFLLIFVSFH